jgi:threonine synthase
MTSFITGLRCRGCGALQADQEAIFACRTCGGFLEARYDLAKAAQVLDRDEISARPRGLWRYRELLPVRDERAVVSLAEGGAPLLRSRRIGPALGLDNLYFKDLTRNPTGSFKDYSSSASVSKAREIGVETIVLMSAGNAASSFAAYCAVAKLRFVALMLANSYEGMIAQNMIYGAEGYVIDGDSAAVGDVAGRLARERGWMNAGVPNNPYRVEGKKTIGFEIVEDLGWCVPDRIVCPTAGGTSILALRKGIGELNELGWVKGLPKLDCVQAESCAPVVNAWRDRTSIVAARHPNSIAIGLLAPNPAAGSWLVEIMNETGGQGETVADDEIRRALSALAHEEGLYVEPSSAAALAGLRKMCARGAVDRQETIVLMLTGSGLKATEVVARDLPKPKRLAAGDPFPA